MKNKFSIVKFRKQAESLLNITKETKKIKPNKVVVLLMDTAVIEKKSVGFLNNVFSDCGQPNPKVVCKIKVEKISPEMHTQIANSPEQYRPCILIAVYGVI